jgi:hypothetical protein
MPNLKLVGSSSALRSIKADSRRVVNWMPVPIEGGAGKDGAQGYLKQCPGLALKATGSGAVRGLMTARGVLYAVIGDGLYRVSSSFSLTHLGNVTASGAVSMQDNETQLCVVAGTDGYVYDLDTGVFAQISDNWRGSVCAEYLDGWGVFAEPGAAQFYLSDNQDFSKFDALNFATAEGSPGEIVGALVKHRELLILKDRTGEVWYSSGDADFPLSRNSGASIEVGCVSGRTLRKVAGQAVWLGRDENGASVVFSMAAYQPIRISPFALEERLTALPDLTSAYAFVYVQEGQSFYVLQVPGLDTTWVYDLAANSWHERGEWNGEWSRWRAECHAYAYGLNIVGGSDGKLYQLDPLSNKYGSDVMCREFISPHTPNPPLKKIRFSSAQFDCDVGEGLPDSSEAHMMMRYSNDGAQNWHNWRFLTLGAIGQTKARAKAHMLGSARDRVWNVRVTDDVACNLLAVVINEV